MNKLFGLFLSIVVAIVPISTGRATLVSLPSPIGWPGLVTHTTGGPFITTGTTLTSAGHYLAYVFVAREAMTISHVGFRAGTSAGSPTMTVSIEGVDTTTGLPNGAATYGGSAGTTGTVSSNTDVLQALGGAATVPAGSTFAVKMALASGTSQIISIVGNAFSVTTANIPYQVVNTGTPTKGAILTGIPTVALGSNSTTFYQVPIAIPASSTTGGTFNNTSSARRGLLFTPPMNARVIGVRWYNNNAVGDYTMCVRTGDASGTEINNSCTAFDGDYTGANGAPISTVYFDNPVIVSAGTAYRISLEPSTATNVNLSAIVLPSANYRSASPAGTTAQYTTFTTSTWDDTATFTVPLMDVIFDQLDNGAGTGGGGRIIGG